jgi:hypothetical protein
MNSIVGGFYRPSISTLPATLVQLDTVLEIALVKLEGKDLSSAKIGFDSFELGSPVILFDFSGRPPSAITATVSSVPTPEGRFRLTGFPRPPEPGTPILNGRGELIGIILKVTQAEGEGLSIQYAHPLLMLAGLP